ncbi:MAG: hypothetical protein AB198_01905 [Parcubacteria bacterium C7867-003]|nr:MAG: hypothetical protein AB198_01905 [Parcubacteria bacterium C7867-003]
MFSFLNSNKEEVAVLIDIGNGTTTGAIVVFEKNQKPRFIYIVKKFFATSESLDPAKLEIEMNSLLDEMLSALIKNGFEHKYWNGRSKEISRVLISFSSPWFLSKTKNIHLVSDKEFIITKAFLDDIVVKEEAVLKNELKNGESGEFFEVIEKSIVHSKINGYVLDNTMNKSTKTFDASLYMSVVSSVFIDKIHTTIHKHAHLPKERVIINTFPLISFSVIRDLFTKESSFILLDVTGEVTDITLVKNDIILETVTIPSGRNFIIRQIAKAFNVSSEIAGSTLRLHLSKKLEEAMSSKMNETLIEVEKEWSIYIENALTELSPEMILPNSIYLTADSDVADLYIDFLNTPKLDTTNVFRKNVKVNHINLEKTASFYQNDSGFILDEFIVLIALFYNKILKTNR